MFYSCSLKKKDNNAVKPFFWDTTIQGTQMLLTNMAHIMLVLVMSIEACLFLQHSHVLDQGYPLNGGSSVYVWVRSHSPCVVKS